MRNLGFIKNTEARRISFAETLRFERIHEAVYRRLGFEILNIEPGAPMDRARTIIDSVLRDG
jgi:predicted ATPase